MNWILGIVGAIVGGALMAASAPFAGVVIGFFVLFLLGSMASVNARLDAAEREIRQLRARPVAEPAVVALVSRAPVDPAPVAPPAPAAPPVVEPQPVVEPTATQRPVAPVAQPIPPPVQRPLPTSPPPVRPVFVAAPRARAVQGPDPVTRFFAAIRSWFTEGNLPVKVGVLVLFAGVAAALRYAAEAGFFTFPIEFRYAGIAAAALGALAWGFRERVRRPAFGLSVQGGAIGVLLLTVFAAYRLHPLLPAPLAFALVVLLVAGSAALALLQDAMWLAALGFLGGYLAPVLISTGSHDHVALFSYYAVLNAAVFAVSWKRAWRLLNLVGFCFTFGVGTAWGVQYYQPDMFATVEPFLVLFFAFYVVIGLLYVLRQTEHRRPFVDGTLVFGTPLLAFPLQAGLLKDDRMGLAFSALVVAGVYLGLMWFLRRRKGERLLTEAYGALAVGFATLAVPLAFSAGTTAGVWALEGVGVAWLGLRQQRTFPWLAGLALQGLAAVAYLVGVFDHPADPDALVLLNPQWLGAAILAFSGFALSLIHDRLRPVAALPALLFLWAVGWWAWGGLWQADDVSTTIGSWRFFIFYLAASAALAATLARMLGWPRLHWLLGVVAPAGLVMVFVATDRFGAPLETPAVGGWATYAAAMAYALWSARDTRQNSPALAHIAMLWTVALAVTLQLDHVAEADALAYGWRFVAVVAPIAALTIGLWRLPSLAAWPRAEAWPRYDAGWYALAMVLLGMAFVGGLFVEGSAAPLPTIPLFNPLELALVGIAALLHGVVRDRYPSLWPLLKATPFVAFAFVTMATLRAVHHLHGEPWGGQVLDSAFSQAALTVVWSLVAVGAWVRGSRRGDRPLWMAGAVLWGLVLAKLGLVDRTYMSTLSGVVSFVAVGLLLVGVGWAAPTPPKRDDEDDAEPIDPTVPAGVAP